MQHTSILARWTRLVNYSPNLASRLHVSREGCVFVGAHGMQLSSCLVLCTHPKPTHPTLIPCRYAFSGGSSEDPLYGHIGLTYPTISTSQLNGQLSYETGAVTLWHEVRLPPPSIIWRRF